MPQDRPLRDLGRFVRKCLDGIMLGTALSALLIYWGASRINEAWHHRGPGTVLKADGYDPRTGDAWGERVERVDESEYRQSQYGDGAAMLFIGLFLWCCAAYCKDRPTKAPDSAD